MSSRTAEPVYLDNWFGRALKVIDRPSVFLWLAATYLVCCLIAIRWVSWVLLIAAVLWFLVAVSLLGQTRGVLSRRWFRMTCHVVLYLVGSSASNIADRRDQRADVAVVAPFDLARTATGATT